MATPSPPTSVLHTPHSAVSSRHISAESVVEEELAARQRSKSPVKQAFTKLEIQNLDRERKKTKEHFERILEEFQPRPSHSRDVEFYAKENKDLHNEVNRLKKEMSTYKGMARRAKEELQKKEKSLAYVYETMPQEKKEMASAFAKKISDLESKITSLEFENSSLQTQLKQLRPPSPSVPKKNQVPPLTVDPKLTPRTSEILKLKEQIASKDAQIDLLLNVNGDLHKRSSAPQSEELNQIREELRTKDGQLNMLLNFNDTLNQQLTMESEQKKSDQQILSLLRDIHRFQKKLEGYLSTDAHDDDD